MKPKRRSGLGLAVVAVSMVGLALAPASSQAATTIGATGTPATAGTDSCLPGRQYTQGTISDDSATYDVPTSVITSWSTRSGAGGGQGALKVMSRDAFNDTAGAETATYTVLQSSPVATISPNQVNTFSVRIPVPGGGEVGYQPLGSTQQCLFDPITVDNTQNIVFDGPSTGEVGTQYTTDGRDPSRRLNLRVTFEPDADVDGWGDETQDQCPGVAGDNNGCPAPPPPPPPPPPDTIKPTLGGLSFARSTFAAAKSGAAFSAQKGKKKKKKKSSAPTGTKVSYALSEAGSVTFTVERKTTGRRVKGKCKTQTRSNRKKSKCTLYKKVTGSFTVAGKPGKNTFTFRGRMGGKALKAGDYRLNGTATDAARNKSVPRNKTFKIVR